MYYYRAFLRDTGHSSISSPGLFASYQESKSVFSCHPYWQYPFYYIFASPSQQGRTVSYRTSLAIFWRRTPCSGHTGRTAPVSRKNARLEWIECRRYDGWMLSREASERSNTSQVCWTQAVVRAREWISQSSLAQRGADRSRIHERDT